ncbi:MAG: hypothetical protein FWH23_02285 [Bacteroidales bacterium]|nr:hypothetical protein [Bacteroidales bacterium]MCL2132826.1 hypothetical protein [Bacteroidales bacterium]
MRCATCDYKLRKERNVDNPMQAKRSSGLMTSRLVSRGATTLFQGKGSTPRERQGRFV